MGGGKGVEEAGCGGVVCVSLSLCVCVSMCVSVCLCVCI
jgi:hypothetical protein